MQRCAIAFFFFCVSLEAGRGVELSNHPIKHVIELLEEMAAKAKHQRQEEEHSYGKFVHWCSSSKKTLETAVDAEKAKIEELEGVVDAKTKKVAELDTQIEELEKELKTMEEAAKAAEERRKEANKIYEDKVTDLEETISAVDKAIEVLHQAKGDVALLQEHSVKRALVLLQVFAPNAFALLQDPKYTFKSGSVIELLKRLAEDFAKQRHDAEIAETNAVNSYALEVHTRDAAIAAVKRSIEAKESSLVQTKKALTEAKSSLETTQGELKDDSAALEDTNKSCTMKAAEWEERTAAYDGQAKAIAEAIKILAKATGVRTDAPSNPVPPPSPVGMLQTANIRAVSFFQVQQSDPKVRAINLLKAQARKMSSQALYKLADAVEAKLLSGSGENRIFKDVIEMVTKMILRLEAEQKDEDAHKAWCDTEIEKTNSSISSKQDEVSALGTKIEEAQAKVQTIAEEIKEALDMSDKLRKHMNTLSEIRSIGHEENAAAIKDAQDAQTAITKAIAVLEDFYEGASLFQRGVDLPEKPATWDSSATAVSDPNAQPDGIITVLKEVSSNFAKLEAETRAQEETDSTAYKKELDETRVELQKRAKEVEMKTQKKQQIIDSIHSMEKKKKGTESEIYSLKVYMTDLEPACIQGDSTYEERKKSRSDEVAALKEARGILKDAFKKPNFLQST